MLLSSLWCLAVAEDDDDYHVVEERLRRAMRLPFYERDGARRMRDATANVKRRSSLNLSTTTTQVVYGD